MPAGDRRMANVRKLMRMAREYEADEGRDLRRFIDFVAERDLVQDQEGQAPLEAEDLDAVRVMTVCTGPRGSSSRWCAWPTWARRGARTTPRCGSPTTAVWASAWPRWRAVGRQPRARRIRERAEARGRGGGAAGLLRGRHPRSGAPGAQRRHRPREAPEPADLDEPMRWIWRAPGAGLATGSEGGRRPTTGAQWCCCAALRPARWTSCSRSRPQSRATRARAAGLEALAAPALAAVPVPEALPVSRLSYSGLERYRRCGYRFYLERALGLPRRDELDRTRARAQPEPARSRPRTSCRAWCAARSCTPLLEELDFGRPAHALARARGRL